MIANPHSFADPAKAHAMRQLRTLLEGVLDARGKVLGAVVVQSYSEDVTYGSNDQSLVGAILAMDPPPMAVQRLRCGGPCSRI